MNTNTKLVAMPNATTKQADDQPSVWNKHWKYTPANATDVGKRFRKVLREQKAAAAAEADAVAEGKVRRIK